MAKRFHVRDWRTGEVVGQRLSREAARAMVSEDTRTLRIYPNGQPPRPDGDDQDTPGDDQDPADVGGAG